jgi:hypothetical protein
MIMTLQYKPVKKMIMTPQDKSESVPNKMRPIYDEISGMTDAFCSEHLDEEYAGLARRLAAALSRKRPSPLERGRPDVWACGIVYALGQVNFLFDKSQIPHMSADELATLFGVSKKTAANKARQIREIFNMDQLDPNWWRPSKLDDNPLAWMVLVNGLAIDARQLPLIIQEELAQSGVIPYVPSRKHDVPEEESPE